MSVVSARPVMPPASRSPSSGPARGWIVNSWVDQLLILLTPLIAAPALWMLHSPRVGIKAETISLIVTAFFATGHHLPGLIRAYGDRELFERFQWRFLLAPPLVFLAYFPLYNYHFDLYRLIILVWATWHGLMQLYGFMRIYDAKVGSTSSTTAHWDWAACLCGFVTPQFFRAEKLSGTLNNWYSLGGPLLSNGTLEALRWGSLGISLFVAVGYSINYVVQTYRGRQPSSLKLLMLISGIGMWWYAIVYVENLILGVALFDICHDVQYLAIVWLFNCRRVSSNPQLGGFMKYVFRRGMVLLYLGLITAYGALGLLGSQVMNGSISQIFTGILFTSTILHYYYDGFIWKVRETANQQGLGVSQSVGSPRTTPAPAPVGNFSHLLKWSPALLIGGLLFTTDFLDPPLTIARKTELDQRYSQALLGTTVLPQDEQERSWLFEQFQRTQHIAAVVPADQWARLRAAIMLANFGRNDEAVVALEGLLQERPTFGEAYLALGSINLYRGNLEQAAGRLESALSYAQTDETRSKANLKLGELLLLTHDEPGAAAKFEEALRQDPKLEPTVAAVRQKVKPSQNPL
ncbi:MAG: hypothetical protein U0872_09835 [Planctomycetaceae bacterium]